MSEALNAQVVCVPGLNVAKVVCFVKQCECRTEKIPRTKDVILACVHRMIPEAVSHRCDTKMWPNLQIAANFCMLSVHTEDGVKFQSFVFQFHSKQRSCVL